MSDRRMTFGDHLDELRKRIFRALLGVIVASVLCLVFSSRIMGVVVEPILEVLKGCEGKLAFMKPQEGFLVFIKVALIVGLFLSSPWVTYQLWAFVAEGLYPHEKKWVRVFGPITFVLFAAGVLFCYFLVLPWGLQFLIGFGLNMDVPGLPAGQHAAEAIISVSEYVSFFLTISILMGVVFQLPLIILFLDQVGIVRARTFARYRRHFIVTAFIVAALLTPPDPVTQIIVAVPILLLFESGLLLARILRRKEATP
jgi:sec-independent protein translocase protein TatC